MQLKEDTTGQTKFSFRDNNNQFVEQNKDQQQEFIVRQQERIRKTEFVLDEYRQQFNGIDGRLNNRKSAMIVSIAVFSVVFLVDMFFCFLLSQPGSNLLAQSWEMWVACIAITVAICKTFLTMLEKIFDYGIHNETAISERYRRSHGIYTLKDEKRFCQQQIKDMEKALQQLKLLKDPDALKPYESIQYFEKRADNEVFPFFEDHEILCYAVIGVITIVLNLL